jgi:hypothetical protein
MDVLREDLVAYALGGLPAEETPRIAAAVAAHPALARELKEIERHLRLHGKAPQLSPAPALWEAIRSRLDEPRASRSLLHRFRLPAAAAALMALAFLWPQQSAMPGVVTVHGEVVRRADGSYGTTGIARVRNPDGVTITIDAGTDFRLLSNERLALGAGRVFLEVPPERSGFTVIAGDLVAVTTGTAFLVDASKTPFVWTESGHVRCSWRGRDGVAGPGETFFASDAPPPPLPPSPRAWFRQPSLDAVTTGRETVRVTISNRMPDPIEVAPSTSGEPLFFASYLGHDYPLALDDFRPTTLEPGAQKTFDLRLPRPIPDGEALVVSYAPGGVSTEARR